MYVQLTASSFSLRQSVRNPASLAVALIGLLLMTSLLHAQQRPYIGYAYPAGGQQGTTFQVLIGGQAMDDVHQAIVSGSGVTARIVEYRRRLNPQEVQLLAEQVRRLRRSSRDGLTQQTTALGEVPADQLVEKLRKRISETVQRPAAIALSSLVVVEVTASADAAPGRRELRIATSRGASNPLAFDIGQLPEVLRRPMVTASYQVLGKEELALRKRPVDEIEQQVTLPCMLNGQIASAELNRYRFTAKKGQRLVFSAEGRSLIPFLADTSPGWFQPVMALYDASGKLVAYNDDYRNQPDPVILYEVPKDGEFILTMADALYRGREDFVYRITAGELPFITSIFPLGRGAATDVAPKLTGWNLAGTTPIVPPADAAPGLYTIAARTKAGIVSNTVPFRIDSLPECAEKEPNDDIAHAQKVELPVIINGRINHSDDWDVFEFAGHAGQRIVAEVNARRLDSPMDSFLKITDASGKVLAFNDDYEDPEAGENTHNADSYIQLKLPADGNYYVHLGDTARHGDDEYAYRLRISEPMPDFALRTVPSSLSIRGGGMVSVAVQAFRKDGFAGPIKIVLKDAPKGFTAIPAVMPANQNATKITLRTDLSSTREPVAIHFEGQATVEKKVIAHPAVAAEDRMQAFLWRHLVPASDLDVMVFDPTYQPPRKRSRRELAVAPATQPAGTTQPAPRFSKQQVESRLRQLKLLYEEGLLTDGFYHEMCLECETGI